jgi:(S)-2-hydroxy-acid oxidase
MASRTSAATVPTDVAVMAVDRGDTLSTITTTTSHAMTPSPPPPLVCSVQDYQVLAQQRLPKALYEYLASGSDDEQTLAENRSAWYHWYLRPRVLRPVSDISTRTTIAFATLPSSSSLSLSMPLFVSPAGVHAVCDADGGGECTTAQACAAAGILFGLSQHSTRSIEDVAASVPTNCATTTGTASTLHKFYQAYLLKDRRMTMHLIQRAVNAGYQGLFLTVDSVRFGYREADARNGFDALPPPHRLVNYDDVGPTSADRDESNNETFERASPSPEIPVAVDPERRHDLESTYNGRKHKSWDQNIELMFAQDASWDDVRSIKRQFPHLPLIVKGIMTGEDAILAVEAGADGIMVSNHGGRQQDGCLASIDALPEVVAAVRSCRRAPIPVFLDGGVRRGSDILKALALGASAVGIGKPVFFALAVGGKPAVTNVLRLLQRELEAAMALTGCQTVADITPALVTRHPYGNNGTYVRAKL